MEKTDTDIDAEIITTCRNGNTEAFSQIVNRYQDLIYKQMRWYSKCDATCEELVQEVFIQAYTSLHTFKEKAPFRHWLRKIASHTAYRFIKNKSRAPEMLSLEEWDASYDPDEEVDHESSLDLLRVLLSKLKAEERLVLTMMYLEELGTKDIATRMGWNRAVVKMRIYRAKKHLRQIIEAENLADKYQI